MSSMQTHEMLEEENDRMVEQMATKVAALKSVRGFVIMHLATVVILSRSTCSLGGLEERRRRY